MTLSHDAPAVVVAGDTIEFLVTIPGDYVAWTGSARLTGPSAMDATSCATEGTDFHVKFAGQATPGTKSLTAGPHLISVWATNATDRVTIAQIPITIEPDLSTGTPELRHAVKMLALVEAAIEARVSGTTEGGIEEYAIEGTSVKKLSIESLERLRARYHAEVRALQNPDAPLPSVKTVFTTPGSASPFYPPYYRGRVG